MYFAKINFAKNCTTFKFSTFNINAKVKAEAVPSNAPASVKILRLRFQLLLLHRWRKNVVMQTKQISHRASPPPTKENLQDRISFEVSLDLNHYGKNVAKKPKQNVHGEVLKPKKACIPKFQIGFDSL